MKLSKLLLSLFLFVIIFLPSCAGAVSGPGETISLSTAFGYYFKQTSYVVTLIVATIVSVALFYYAIKKYNRDQDVSFELYAALFLALAIFLGALLIAPGESAFNTTVEMFQRTGKVI